VEGLNVMLDGEKNKFKNYFDGNNRLTRLINVFKPLIFNPLVPEEIINYISISIYELSNLNISTTSNHYLLLFMVMISLLLLEKI
jgi:hypothetical protein